MAKHYHNEDKSIPFKYVFSKKKKKHVKTKNNPSLFRLFLTMTLVRPESSSLSGRTKIPSYRSINVDYYYLG